MTKRNDFGASHEFKTKRVNIPLKKDKEDMKVSRTFHIKLKYLEYMDKNDIGRDVFGNLNWNKGINILLQHGIAHIEEQRDKNQKQLTEYKE